MGLIGWRVLTRLTCFVCRYVFALSSLVWCAIVVDLLVLDLVVCVGYVGARWRSEFLLLSWPVVEDYGSVVLGVGGCDVACS